ncbi:carbohydrate kinase family protein [Streptomyces inhibens]|uniref:carbohydrate kinase family protein n=1 Tax=Streptomyces inhibens TaxID=2293571 RepID=UPI001EE75309|nr:carbohydrate kinase family protein [Streptomyces inhibens]UKY53520.1 carbohydrate kinase family protein [Streptomyces inhibens]
MRIAVTGSIATDHLATFPGRFADELMSDHLAHVSLSFLVDDLEVRRGGVAANIAFGLGVLGLTPYLAGAVGTDFDEYRIWLKEHGVDAEHVRVSSRLQTARFMCTTDLDRNQIASFYAGAMAEAAQIDLSRVAERTGGIDLVLLSPNSPDAMLRHTEQCRQLRLPFAADPSQQLARLTREEVRHLITGARWLFTNAYESALLLEISGWTREEILSRLGAWITTRGADGVSIETADEEAVSFPAVAPSTIVDPTGFGDAFRAGFLAGTSWRRPVLSAIPLGCALATRALESVGSQQYTVSSTDLLTHIADTFGGPVTALLAPHVETRP